MKKRINTLLVILFFSLLPMPLFSSCDKDTNCYIDVFVRDEVTRNPISGAKIVIKQDKPASTIHAEGITNNEGIFSTHFIAPAIVSVKARLDVDNGGFRTAETSIRLKEGETVTANVTLPIQIEY